MSEDDTRTDTVQEDDPAAVGGTSNGAPAAVVEAAPEPPASPEQEAPEDDEQQASPAAPLLRELEDLLGMRVIVYYADDSSSMGRGDVVPMYRLLDLIGPQEKAALVIQTPGGSADTAHVLGSLLHDYIGELHIYIPTYAASAGTLLALNADVLWMGPTSELSPIDPQIPIDPNMLIPTSDPSETPYGPGETMHIPAHVIKDFLELTGIIDSGSTRPRVDTARLESLLRPLNPWILGWYERADKVSRIYAREALANHLMKGADDAAIDNIVDKLVDHYASHNAGILRRGATRLGIPFQECPPEVWELLERVDDFYEGVFRAQRLARVLETTDGAHATAAYRERTCGNCGEATQVNRDFIYCPACGSPYDSLCGSCNGVVEDGWKFCPRCRSALDDGTADPVVDTQPVAAPAPQRP